MRMNQYMEILNQESPFFIQDICIRYSIPYTNISNFIRDHKELFLKNLEHEGKNGRPRYKYTVIQNEIHSTEGSIPLENKEVPQ